MTTQKKNSYYIHSIISLALIFGIGFLPPIEPITQSGMQLLGILIGLIYAWSFVGLLWPSLIGTLAISIFGIAPFNDILKMGYGSDVTQLILFIFVFAALIEEAGLSKGLAMFFITRKCFMGKPWIFSFILLFSAYLLSAATSTIAAIIICWSITYKICAQIGYKPGDTWPKIMTFGIVLACTLGLSLFPFKSVPLVVLGAYSTLSDIHISFLSYICFSAPMGILAVLLYTVLCKFVFRPDVSNLKNLSLDNFDPEERNVKFSKEQKIDLMFLLAMIVLLLVPSILPSEWGITKLLVNIGATGTIILIIALMCFLTYDRRPLLDFKKMATGIQWDVVVLTATVLPLASFITSDSTGIIPFLTKILNPIFQGKPPILFIILTVILAAILTNLCNNAVTGIMLVTITYGFASANDINTVMLAMIITFIVHLAVLTPAGSPMAAVLHGDRTWISAKDIYTMGSISILAICIMAVILGPLLAEMIF